MNIKYGDKVGGLGEFGMLFDDDSVKFLNANNEVYVEAPVIQENGKLYFGGEGVLE